MRVFQGRGRGAAVRRVTMSAGSNSFQLPSNVIEGAEFHCDFSGFQFVQGFHTNFTSRQNTVIDC